MDHLHHSVTFVSESFVKPNLISIGSKQNKCYMTPWDLAMLSIHYFQKGLLYIKPPNFDIESFSDQLKSSLAATLTHFYPLAGRLETLKEENPHSYLVYINCEKGPGARFINATTDLSIADVMEATYVSPVVRMFFDHDQCVNHEGHEKALVSIQVTELVDGIFVGCSMNHSIGDGTSYWHFFNTLSEIFQAQAKGLVDQPISRPPVLERWFPDGHGLKLSLPYKHQKEFVSRHKAPELMERFWHFSPESIARLKAKANKEAGTTNISSFQALSALLWRTITRARNYPSSHTVGFRLAADLRHRMSPPLSPDYFGNCTSAVKAVATAGELLDQNLGWAAMKLHQTVVSFTNEDAFDFLNRWLQAPSVHHLSQPFDPDSVMIGGSPRFNMYGNEFGLGKALGPRSGYANKFDGRVSSYPGFEGGGSMDLEICLTPENMKAFECDPELLDAVSVTT